MHFIIYSRIHYCCTSTTTPLFHDLGSNNRCEGRHAEHQPVHNCVPVLRILLTCKVARDPSFFVQRQKSIT